MLLRMIWTKKIENNCRPVLSSINQSWGAHDLWLLRLWPDHPHFSLSCSLAASALHAVCVSLAIFWPKLSHWLVRPKCKGCFFLYSAGLRWGFTCRVSWKALLHCPLLQFRMYMDLGISRSVHAALCLPTQTCGRGSQSRAQICSPGLGPESSSLAQDHLGNTSLSRWSIRVLKPKLYLSGH